MSEIKKGEILEQVGELLDHLVTKRILLYHKTLAHDYGLERVSSMPTGAYGEYDDQPLQIGEP